MPASRRPLLLAFVVTALIAVSRLHPVAPLLDAATGLPPTAARLSLPFWHVALTPWTTLGDLAACSSVPQALALLSFLLALVGPARWGLGQGWDDWFSWGASFKAVSLHFVACVLVLAWGVLWQRDPAGLTVYDPELMTVDFHSHTSASWDGRAWFTPTANLRWHGRAGFGAAFITDHNLLEGAREARRYSATAWEAGRRDLPAGLEGEELSLHGAHVLLLGPTRAASPNEYEGLDGLRRFLGDASPHFGGIAVMSLPEYYRHHSRRMEQLADWGAGGFEILAASPKGLGVPAAFRREVVELCRRRGLIMTGGSDNHGYGSTNCAWNLVRVPGWRAMDPGLREKAVMAALRVGGFSAVTVIARARCLSQPASPSELALDGPRSLWRAVRAWNLAQCAVSLLWAWALALACGAVINNKLT